MSNQCMVRHKFLFCEVHSNVNKSMTISLCKLTFSTAALLIGACSFQEMQS